MKQLNILTMVGLLAIATAILIPTTRAFADDSIARLGAGGIAFLKSENIRMLEEILWISQDAIRVKLRFLNESDQDIHTTVAFPLPPKSRPDGGGFQRSNKQLKTSFTVRVDGRLVPTASARKAVVGDHDVTAELRELGLSDEQIFSTFHLTRDQRAALEKLDGGKAGHLDWKVAETLFWRQSFPAGKEVVVEHAYAPIAGGSFTIPYRAGFEDVSDVEKLGITHGVCLDDATRRAIENRVKAYAAKAVKGVKVDNRDIEYILGTGRNWKGPIGKFTLRIEKKSPDQFISLCFPGKPRKVSPTVYEFIHKDFVPPDRLIVAFYNVREW